MSKSRRQTFNLIPAKETRCMATPTRLAELEQRHQMLEAELADALQHLSTDDFQLAELKRRKLQVKDEIARLNRARLH
jgi:hypothetical protein